MNVASNQLGSQLWAFGTSKQTLQQLAEKSHRPPEKIFAYFAL